MNEPHSSSARLAEKLTVFWRFGLFSLALLVMVLVSPPLRALDLITWDIYANQVGTNGDPAGVVSGNQPGVEGSSIIFYGNSGGSVNKSDSFNFYATASLPKSINAAMDTNSKNYFEFSITAGNHYTLTLTNLGFTALYKSGSKPPTNVALLASTNRGDLFVTDYIDLTQNTSLVLTTTGSNVSSALGGKYLSTRNIAIAENTTLYFRLVYFGALGTGSAAYWVGTNAANIDFSIQGSTTYTFNPINYYWVGNDGGGGDGTWKGGVSGWINSNAQSIWWTNDNNAMISSTSSPVITVDIDTVAGNVTNNSDSGTVTLTGGALKASSLTKTNEGNLNIFTPLTLNESLFIGGGFTTLQASNTISGKINVTGGTLLLNNTNTVNQGLNVTGGILRFGVDNALSGRSAFVVNGGTLDLGRKRATAGGFTIMGNGTVTAGTIDATTINLNGGSIYADLTGTANLIILDGTTYLYGSNSFTGYMTNKAATNPILVLASSNALPGRLILAGSSSIYTAPYIVLGKSGNYTANYFIGGNVNFGATNSAVGASTLTFTNTQVMSGGSSPYLANRTMTVDDMTVIFNNPMALGHGSSTNNHLDFGGNGTIVFNEALVDPSIGAEGISLGTNTNGWFTGTVILNATNQYTGITTVSNGVLQVNGATAEQSVTTVSALSGNLAILSGTGTVGGVTTIGAYGAVQPGNKAPATLRIGTVGSTNGLILENGGNYNFFLKDASGTAGSGYSTLSIAGQLDLSALTSGGFQVNLWTLSASNRSGLASNFNLSNSYTWILASAGGGIVGFDSGSFSINTNATNGTDGFQNRANGRFSVAQSGSQLQLKYTPVSTLTWAGGNGSWATGVGGWKTTNGIATNWDSYNYAFVTNAAGNTITISNGTVATAVTVSNNAGTVTTFAGNLKADLLTMQGAGTLVLSGVSDMTKLNITGGGAIRYGNNFANGYDNGVILSGGTLDLQGYNASVGVINLGDGNNTITAGFITLSDLLVQGTSTTTILANLITPYTNGFTNNLQGSTLLLLGSNNQIGGDLVFVGDGGVLGIANPKVWDGLADASISNSITTNNGGSMVFWLLSKDNYVMKQMINAAPVMTFRGPTNGSGTATLTFTNGIQFATRDDVSFGVETNVTVVVTNSMGYLNVTIPAGGQYDTYTLNLPVDGTLFLNTILADSQTNQPNAPGFNTITNVSSRQTNGEFIFGLFQSGTGTVILNAKNTYTGATTVNGGTLQVNGSLYGDGTVTVNNSGILTGGGSVGNVTVNSGATISPGNGIGKITMTSAIWNGGGNYNWQVYNATGVAGTGYDTLSIAGVLDLSGLSSSNQFNINVWSISTTNGTNGQALNFINTNNYRWTLVSFRSITNFDASFFDININASNGTAGFSNSFTGTFKIATNASSLLLTYTRAPGTNLLWNGGSSNNWTTNPSVIVWKDEFGDPMPFVASDNVTFGTNSTVTVTNSGVTAGVIIVTNSASSTVLLKGGSISASSLTNSGAGNLSISNTLLALSNSFFNRGSGIVRLYTGVNASDLSQEGSGNLQVLGRTSLNGNVSATAGTLTIASGGLLTNNGSGFIGVNSGRSAQAIVPGTWNIGSSLYIGSGGGTGTLIVSDGGTVNIAGDAYLGNGLIQLIGNMKATAVSIGGSGTLQLTGSITANSVTITNGGTLVAGNTNVKTNSWELNMSKGTLSNAVGTLSIGGAITLQGNSTLILGGFDTNSVYSSKSLTVNGTNNFISLVDSEDYWTNTNAPYTLLSGANLNYGGAIDLITFGQGTLSVGTNTVILGRSTFNFNTNSNGFILNVSGGPDSLIWIGDAINNQWNTNRANTNWYNTRNGSNDSFYSRDSVTFGNGATYSPVIVASQGVVAGTISITNSTGVVILTNGLVSGRSLTKSGDGSLLFYSALNLSNSLAVSGVNQTVFASNVSADSLLMSGYGTLSLLASNSIGSITLTSGALGISNNYSLGSGSLVFAGNGTVSVLKNVTVTNASVISSGVQATFAPISYNLTYSGLISGQGSLKKDGAGTLTLTGLNSYSGGTLISNGTVALITNTSLGSGIVTFAGNGIVKSLVSLNLTNAFMISNGVVATLDSGPNTLTYSGLISGPGLLKKFGVGTLTLARSNNYTAGTVIAQGILATANTNALGTGLLTLTNPGSTLSYTTGSSTLSVAGVMFSGGTSINLIEGGSISSHGSVIFTNSLNFISLLGPWQTEGTNVLISGSSFTGTNYVALVIGTNTVSLGTVFTNNNAFEYTFAKTPTSLELITKILYYCWNTNLTSGAWDYTSKNWTVGGIDTNFASNANVTFITPANVSLNNAVLTAGTILVANSTGSVILQGPGTIRAEYFTNSGTGSLLVNDVLLISNALSITAKNSSSFSASVSASSLRMNGSGTLSLSSSNRFGWVGITNGSVVVGNNYSLGTNSVTLSNAIFSSSISDLSISNALTLGGGVTVTNERSVNLAGTIMGTGTLTKIGGGTLALSSLNTYSGGTIVSGGVLLLSSAAATIGSTASSVVINNGAAIDLGKSSVTNSSLTIYGGALKGTGTITASTYTMYGGTVEAGLGSGILTVAGSATLAGTSLATNVTIKGGSLLLSFPSSNRLATNAIVNLWKGATLDLANPPRGANQTLRGLTGYGIVTNASGNLTINISSGVNNVFAGTISGAGGVTMGGSGTLTLAGTNTYMGLTTISNGGSIVLLTSNALSVGSSLLLDNGTLAVGTNNVNLGNSIFTGTVTLASGTITGSGTITATRYMLTNGSISNSLAGGSVTISKGIVVLGGKNNTYAGPTVVGNGTLTASSVGSGPLTLSNSVFTNTATSKISLQSLNFNGNSSLAFSTPMSAVCITFGGSTTNLFSNVSIINVIDLGNGPVTNTVTNIVTNVVGGTNNLLRYSGSIATSGTNVLISGIVGKSASPFISLTNTIFFEDSLIGITNLAYGSSVTVGGWSYLFTNAGGLAIVVTDYGNLIWIGGANRNWNTNSASTNWFNTITSRRDFFSLSNNVTFGNAATNGVINVADGGVTAGSVTVSNSAGTVSFGGGTITASSFLARNAGSLLISNALSLGSGTLVDSGAGLVTLAGKYAKGSLIMTGSGTLSLAFSNSYAGGTVIMGGTVNSTTSSYGLGSGSVTIKGGQLILGESTNIVAGVTLGSGTISGTKGGLLRSVSGYNVTNGLITANLSGGVLNKGGANTVTLTGSNSYYGGTIITGGTLVAGNSYAIPYRGALLITNGTLAAGANNLTFGTVPPAMKPTTLVSWDIFTGLAPTNNATAGVAYLTAPGVGASDITYNGPSINNTTSLGYGLYASAITATNYFDFNVTAASGFTMTLTNLGFTSIFNQGGSGPTNVALLMSRDSEFGTYTNITSNGVLRLTGNTQTSNISANLGGTYLSTNNVIVDGGKTLYFRLLYFTAGSTASGDTWVGTNVSCDFSILGYVAMPGVVTLASGTITGSGTLTAGGNYSLMNGAISNSLAGTASLSVSNGTMVLGGTNTYLGGTTVGNGTLSASSVGSGPLTLSNAVFTNTSSSKLSVYSLNFNGNSSLFLSNAMAVTKSITFGGTFDSNNTNPLQLLNYLNYSGIMTASGTNVLISGMVLGAAATNIVFNDSMLGITNLAFGSSAVVGSSTYLFTNAGGLAIVASRSSANLVWIGKQSKDWNTNPANVNWYNSSIGSNDAFYSRDNVSFGNAATTNGAINITNTGVTAGSVTVNNSLGTVTLAGGGITASSFVKNNSGNLLISTSLSLGAGTLVNIGSGSVTIAGKYNTGSLLMGGAGTMRLAVSNSYSGGTIVRSGTLDATSVNSSLGSGSVTLTGGLLQLGGNSNAVAGVTLGNGTISGALGSFLVATNGFSVTNGLISANLKGGVLTKSGSGTVMLSGSNSYAQTVINGGLLVASNAYALANTNVYVNAGILSLKTNVLARLVQLGNGTISGVNFRLINTSVSATNTGVSSILANLSGNGSVTMGGMGTLTLSGSNSYSGGTLITNGTLAFTASNNTFGGVITVANGALSFSYGSANATAPQSLGTNANLLLGTNGSKNNVTLLYNGTGNVTLAKNITVYSSGLSVIKNTDTNNFLTLTGKICVKAGQLSFIGNINNPSILYGDPVYDGGTKNLGAINDYSDAPTFLINGVVVNANVSGALPTNSRTDVYMDVETNSNVNGTGSSVLNINTDQTISSLAGTSSSRVNLNNSALTIGKGYGNTVFRGNVSGNGGSLLKDGASTLTLTGNNSYTGGTVIVSGAVAAASSNALGSGTLTLGGSGKLLLQSMLTIDSMIWNSTNSTVAFSSLTNSYYLNVTKSVTLSGAHDTNYFDLTGVESQLSGTASRLFAFGTNTFTTNQFGIMGSLPASCYALTISNNALWVALSSNTLPVFSHGTNLISNSVTNPSVTFGMNSTLNITSSGRQTVTTNVTVSNSSILNVDGMLTVSNSSTLGNLTIQPGSRLTGVSIINANIINNGSLMLIPLNTPSLPDSATINGSVTLNSSSTMIVGIAGPTYYSTVTVNGPMILGGILSVQPVGYTLSFGQKFDILNASSISGAFSSIEAPVGFRGRMLLANDNTLGTLLIAPASYTQVAQNQNQMNVAKALDTFIPVTSGDKLVVSTALDELTASQYPQAFNQIAPLFYQQIPTIAFNLANAQNNELVQRLYGLRVAGSGFSMNGFADNTAVMEGQGDKGVLDSSKDILRPGPDNRWGMFVDGYGIFGQANSANMLPGYNFESGGVNSGLTYKWSDSVGTGIYAGYQGAYSKNNGLGTLVDNAVKFGAFATYGRPDGKGLYMDALVGGGYHNYTVSRLINFGSISRTANSSPGAGELDSMLAVGYNWKKGNWSFGPIASLQYSYLGVNSFSETGAQSLNLSNQGWSASSMISSLGVNCAYSWQANRDLMVVPQINLSWQHEFLQNPYAINSSVGGSPNFSTWSATPNRDTLYTGVGVTLEYKQKWNTSFFYNAAAGNQNLTSQNIFWSLGVKF